MLLVRDEALQVHALVLVVLDVLGTLLLALLGLLLEGRLLDDQLVGHLDTRAGHPLVHAPVEPLVVDVVVVRAVHLLALRVVVLREPAVDDLRLEPLAVLHLRAHVERVVQGPLVLLRRRDVGVGARHRREYLAFALALAGHKSEIFVFFVLINN